MEQTKKKVGKLIRSTLIKMYPGSFLYALMIGFMYMVDSILAGNTLGAGAIAAAAIGLPCYGMFLALMNAIIHGTSLRVTWAKGRADQKKFQRAFAGGLTFAGIAGLLFMTIVIVLSAPMTAAFGGAKATKEISDYALLYLRCCAPMIFLSAISGCVRECVGVLGYQTERAALGIIDMVCNLIISIVFVMLLPKEIKMAGLGIGSSAAALKDALIDASTSKQNNSARGVMGKLRDVFQNYWMGYKETISDSANYYDYMRYGMIDPGVNTGSAIWSLSQYQTVVRKDGMSLKNPLLQILQTM